MLVRSVARGDRRQHLQPLADDLGTGAVAGDDGYSMHSPSCPPYLIRRVRL
jgi:hypothetical protein